MADRFYRGSELRWTTLHPEHWTTIEVAGWVSAVIKANEITGDDSHVINQAFETVTGRELISMAKDDFINLLGQHGEFMHSCFKTVYSVVPTGNAEDLLRSLTPISERTSSEGSPESETDQDHVQSTSETSASTSNPGSRNTERDGDSGESNYS